MAGCAPYKSNDYRTALFEYTFLDGTLYNPGNELRYPSKVCIKSDKIDAPIASLLGLKLNSARTGYENTNGQVCAAPIKPRFVVELKETRGGGAKEVVAAGTLPFVGNTSPISFQYDFCYSPHEYLNPQRTRCLLAPVVESNPVTEDSDLFSRFVGDPVAHFSGQMEIVDTATGAVVKTDGSAITPVEIYRSRSNLQHNLSLGEVP